MLTGEQKEAVIAKRKMALKDPRYYTIYSQEETLVVHEAILNGQMDHPLLKRMEELWFHDQLLDIIIIHALRAKAVKLH